MKGLVNDMKATEIMFLETRHYNKGDVEARLTHHRPVTDVDDNTGKYDFYVETIGEGGDYKELAEWIEMLEIELDDVTPLVMDLTYGKWVDITTFC